MVGLGEMDEQVYKIMDDLLEYGCDVMIIGQYLQFIKMYFDVVEYVYFDKFVEYKEVGLFKGFDFVESVFLVCFSYYVECYL